MAKVVIPYTRIGGWAVEVIILGEDTKELDEISEMIHTVITEKKQYFEKKY